MRQKPLYWRQKSVGIGTNQEELVAPLKAAIDQWNQVECGKVRLHWDPTSDNQVYLRTADEWRYSSKVLAMTTQIYFGDPHVYQKAIIEVNQKNRSWTFMDYKNVLLHELGHVLGLEHASDFSAVMHPNGQLGDEERVLSKADQQAYCELEPLREPHREAQALTAASGCAQVPGQTAYLNDLSLMLLIPIMWIHRKHSLFVRSKHRALGIGF